MSKWFQASFRMFIDKTFRVVYSFDNVTFGREISVGGSSHVEAQRLPSPEKIRGSG
jgi:hypothetical protein